MSVDINNEVLQALSMLAAEIRMLDKCSLAPVYENNEAKKNKLTTDDKLTIKALVERLETGKTRLLDKLYWDANAKKWRRRRIFDAGDYYWLAVDWTSDKDGLDPIMELLFRFHTWDQRMEILANILGAEFDIRRVRFYRITTLFKTGSELYDVRGEDYLLQPIWSVGGGFKSTEREWLKSEIPFHRHPISQELFGKSKENFLRTSGETQGNPAVGWGDSMERVCFAIRDGDGDRPAGMLAVDRRSDHLDQIVRDGSDFDESFDVTTIEHVQSFLDKVKLVLKDINDDRNLRRNQLWNNLLGKISKEAISHKNAVTALRKTLEGIQGNWEAGGVHLRDVYVAKIYNLGEKVDFHVWEGVGPICEWRRKKSYSRAEPFINAAKQTTVIHDFDIWRDKLTSAEKSHVMRLSESNPQVLDGMESWLGIPLKQGNQTIGIFVATVARKHYFTKARVEGLQETVDRMMPMFLWGLA